MSWQHTGGSTRIDSVATLGLDGVADSLAYRAGVLARHHHSYEHWFGLATAPDAELHRADIIGTTTTAFQMDGGNDTWGSWLQILGSGDTPHVAGEVHYDLHKLSFVAVERANAIHLIQVAFGASGAAALSAHTVTEKVLKPQTVQGSETILTLQIRRQDAGTKAWIRQWVVGQNTGTSDFFLGLHEYEG